MIDIKIFRENPDLIRESQKKRQLDMKYIDDVIRYDKEYGKLQYEVQKLKHKRNVVNEGIVKLKKEGKKAEKEIKDISLQ